MGRGIIANNAQNEDFKAKDYAMLKELGTYDDGTAKAQLEGRAQATEAGLKGQDRARAQDTAGMQAATQYAGVLEQVAQRRDSNAATVAARLLQIKQHAEDMRTAAAARGTQVRSDSVKALHAQLSSVDSDIKNMSSNPSSDPAELRTLRQEAAQIRGDLNTYAVGDSKGKLTGKKSAAGDTVLKFDIKGNPI